MVRIVSQVTLLRCQFLPNKLSSKAFSTAVLCSVRHFHDVYGTFVNFQVCFVLLYPLHFNLFYETISVFRSNCLITPKVYTKVVVVRHSRPLWTNWILYNLQCDVLNATFFAFLSQCVCTCNGYDVKSCSKSVLTSLSSKSLLRELKQTLWDFSDV